MQDELDGDDDVPIPASDDQPLEVDVRIDDDISSAVLEAFGGDTSHIINRFEIAASAAAQHRGFTSGEIGIFATTDPAIREINRLHLSHDYATDVISFSYQCESPLVQGELTVSLEMALAQSRRIGRPPIDEAILYVIHGVLHVTGMDDHDVDDRRAMRTCEQAVLRQLGLPDAERFDADRFDALDGLDPTDSAPTRST
ncbi:rRNA maturation RNase YbeY [Crateriforma conspicua]|uniref:rRNA maturation RNase YbeY n=1 Tax=Crateriforma conspicua TaxID=2527996 RepID=UPI001188FF09|nr:rRNA maturation RNase YbeY [Crateriforma conspicua]QDV64121.1 Endoribonuclease YbeY [Crateriforma conspicua]